jgi:hypothetical protein
VCNVALEGEDHKYPVGTNASNDWLLGGGVGEMVGRRRERKKENVAGCVSGAEWRQAAADDLAGKCGGAAEFVEGCGGPLRR